MAYPALLAARTRMTIAPQVIAIEFRMADPIADSRHASTKLLK